ncbi:lipopolysaccharide biosynthesis protein [Marinilabiliaceae bacterium JC017]|nr:lipopolysaccharide biosynthesis protein [Marinilabiliaceae bacterium JC017]
MSNMKSKLKYSYSSDLQLDNEEIDLVALVKNIWEKRRIVYHTVVICLLFGLLYSFIKPVKYSSYAILLPSASISSDNMGGIGAIAGLAGINIASLGESAVTIPPELYPEIIGSLPFQRELVNEHYSFKEYHEPVSYYEFYMSDTIESFGDKVLKYTVLLPWTIKDEVNGERILQDSKDTSVICLTEQEVEMYKEFAEKIQVDFNNKSGLVVIKGVYEEQLIVAQLVNKTVEKLQRYVTAYKTKQVRQNLDFIQARYNEKKEEYSQLQKRLYAYKDQHRNVVSERIDMEYKHLSDEFSVTSDVFNSLAQQLEQAKIAVSENTPAFTILEPAKVPLEKDGPRKLIVLVISGILGTIFGITLLLLKDYFEIIKGRWKRLD